LQREAGLNAKGYSERDEKRILDALGRGLLREFPNPERVGCPGTNILRKIVVHEMPLSEAEKWLDHLGSCSPCYADFKRLQAARESRRTRLLLATAAGILLAIAITGWALLHKRNESLTGETAVLDLTSRSLPRGTEANPKDQPLEINRKASQLTILLPRGSRDGTYDVRITKISGEEIITGTGTATFRDHVTSLYVVVHLNSLRQGNYLMQIRRRDSEWISYGLVLR
jgi:hypothetical protein